MKHPDVGKYYNILAKTSTREAAREKVFSTMVKGKDAYFGLDANTGKYLVFSKAYNSGFDAQVDVQELENADINVLETLFYK